MKHVLMISAALLLGAFLTGCVGYVGPDGGGYVDTWGPDVYVFGGGHWGHDHDFARRGFASRSAGGFHGGGHGFSGGHHR